MRVALRDKRMVSLKHFEFSYLSYALLLNIQQQVPNLLLEITPDKYPTCREEMRQFVPAHSIDLEDYRLLVRFNP